MAERLPNPNTEIRIMTLHATRGANYWSELPITRMDLNIGAYENISSADVPGFTESLVQTMPGLRDHRCSIGEPGGFIIRLKHGTYFAHIVEHVALELQGMIGHDVGYGRTRGGDAVGEYTIIFEHLHDAVGLRSAALALEIVQTAFMGSLTSIDHAVAELAALAQTPAASPLLQHVLCGISGGHYRQETRDELVRLGFSEADLIVDVSPSYLLQAGLPYSHSRIAIITDAKLSDVPERFRQPRRAQRLVSVVADAVPSDGTVIVPAKEWEIQDRVRDTGRRVAIFATDADVTPKDKKVARTCATVDGRRIMIEHFDSIVEAGWLHDKSQVTAQVAAALAAFTLRELHEPTFTSRNGTDPALNAESRPDERAGVAD
ncbi:MAG: cyanophycin synthetase family protein [Gemmatimonadaceae bacterium]